MMGLGAAAAGGDGNKGFKGIVAGRYSALLMGPSCAIGLVSINLALGRQICRAVFDMAWII